jgi:hypothetical protein
MQHNDVSTTILCHTPGCLAGCRLWKAAHPAVATWLRVQDCSDVCAGAGADNAVVCISSKCPCSWHWAAHAESSRWHCTVKIHTNYTHVQHTII